MVALTAGCAAGPVTVDASAPDPADRSPCRALLDDLPEQVADQRARATDPTDGWGAAWGDPPIVLTCGSTAPAGFGRASTCTTVDGVDWYLPEKQLQEPDGGGGEDLTMTTVHRAQYVEVRMPFDYWPPATTLADLSEVVRTHLEATGHCR